MIYDNIMNSDIYSNYSVFMEAFKFIIDAEDKICGKYNISDEICATIMEINTSNCEDNIAEGHKKYIDIQFVLSGIEIMGFSQQVLNIITPYDSEKDILIVQSNLNFVTLKKGDFAIFFPNDYHKPGLGSGECVKKIVIKIPFKELSSKKEVIL